jgi:glycolate oxidase iron-sulfur subunit
MAASENPQGGPVFPPILDGRHPDAPAANDLLACIHCGLCLNACPTYRELGVEMDSPRGRIYQMMQVATGQVSISPSYLEHLNLCLACRGCESACPSGVQYGRLIEAARAEIEAHAAPTRPASERLLRNFVYRRLLLSRGWMKLFGALLYLYQASALQAIVRGSGILKLLGKLGRIEHLAPTAEVPFFFDKIGRTFPPTGPRRYRVGLLAGCIANVFSARLNEATVRVLQANGCEVLVPESQTCCGALHVHAGLKDDARALARRNIDAFLPLAEDGGLDAIVTNGAGCGSTLKEYEELLHGDPAYAAGAARFTGLMKDITEFLASIELNPAMGRLDAVVTYQDSCHLAHGQKIRQAPRQILKAIPGVQLREMPLADLCCGSAGIYNVVHDDIADSLIARKIPLAAATGATVIATANVGCQLQLKAGIARYGNGQRVVHVVELLDEAYQKLGR